jgi:hypothetical protein
MIRICLRRPVPAVDRISDWHSVRVAAVQMVRRYIHDAELSHDNPAAKLGL